MKRTVAAAGSRRSAPTRCRVRPRHCRCGRTAPAPTSGRSCSTGSAGVLLAGIIAQPTAFQGDAYLLPSVAAVVLGGTSLLGGRGYLVATVVAALFLSQLEQFVLALGVSFAIRTLVEAAALAVGVALYSRQLGRRLLAGRRRTPAPAMPEPARRTRAPSVP